MLLSLTYNSRAIIYDCNMFIVQANGVEVINNLSLMLCHNKIECLSLASFFMPNLSTFRLGEF
jgi:hypothetical protein